MEDKKYYIFPGHFEKDSIRPSKDGSWKAIFYALELSPDSLNQLVSLAGKSGSMVFVEANSDTTIEDLDVPDVKVDFRGEKTPSQRLRAVLYRLWEQSKTELDFEVFYRSKMDRLIDQLKDKLD